MTFKTSGNEVSMIWAIVGNSFFELPKRTLGPVIKAKAPNIEVFFTKSLLFIVYTFYLHLELAPVDGVEPPQTEGQSLPHYPLCYTGTI